MQGKVIKVSAGASASQWPAPFAFAKGAEVASVAETPMLRPFGFAGEPALSSSASASADDAPEKVPLGAATDAAATRSITMTVISDIERERRTRQRNIPDLT